jgi:hypothetical protein
MKMIEVKDEKYIVKKEFLKKNVKDIKALGDLKWVYGADTILKSKDGETLILAQKVEDAVIVEE